MSLNSCKGSDRANDHPRTKVIPPIKTLSFPQRLIRVSNKQPNVKTSMTKGLYALSRTFTNTHWLPFQHNNGENEWGGGTETRVFVHTWCIFAWVITSEVTMSSVLLLRGHKLLVLGTWESSCLLLRNYLLDPIPQHPPHCNFWNIWVLCT